MHGVEGVALPRDWGCISFVPLILTSSPCLPTHGFSLWNKLPSRWANSAPREQLCRPSLKTARDKSELPTQAPALCTRISAFSSAGTAKMALVFATLLCRRGGVAQGMRGMVCPCFALDLAPLGFCSPSNTSMAAQKSEKPTWSQICKRCFVFQPLFFIFLLSVEDPQRAKPQGRHNVRGSYAYSLSTDVTAADS